MTDQEMPFEWQPISDRDRDLASCKPGNYPWDHWQSRAIEAGLSEELAGLGRAIMREAYNHSWRDDLQSECGWDDDGETMLEHVLENPTAAAQRWHYLLRTDGEVVPDPQEPTAE